MVRVETKGCNQDGTLVCVFRRKVLVPRQSYFDAGGGDQPGRPELVEPSAQPLTQPLAQPLTQALTQA